MRRALVAALVTMALVLTACGGGKKSGSGQTIGTGDAPAEQGPVLGSSTTQGISTPDAGVGRQIAAPWAAPSSGVASLIRRAGLPTYPGEKLAYHIHSHLDVFVDGHEQPVAAQLGIDLDQGVISPLHTHDTTGIVHIESDKAALFHLGQLFVEWDVRMDDTCIGSYCTPDTPIAVYVDGKKATGSPADIELTAHREIAIVIGTPPRSIPSSYDWPPNT